MAMTARERILTCLAGEEPDKIPVCVYGGMTWSGGDMVSFDEPWTRRLMKRGMCLNSFASPHKPVFGTMGLDRHLENVKYTEITSVEKGISKIRRIFETPVGTISEVLRESPTEGVPFGAKDEFLVKERSDWRVINYIFKGMLNKMAPNYDEFKRVEEELGDAGITFAYIGRTPYQRAWIDLATLERTLIDFDEKPEEIQEYIEIQRQLHTRIAEIAAESPALFIDIMDHPTDITPPKYYREYCIPFYEIYSKALDGTGKVLGIHSDGRFGHLKKEFADSSFKVIESYTVPPVGDVSLTEAKSLWPDKMLFVNCPPHLYFVEYEEIRKGYESLADEWGSKKGILIENSEPPLAKGEMHLSAALDALGY